MKKTTETHDKDQIAPDAEKQQSKLDEQLAILFERMDREIVLPRKYYPALEYFTHRTLKAKFAESPSMPIKDVVSSTIQSLDPRIPADKVLEMTAFVIKTWNGFSKPAKPKPSVQRKRSMPANA